MINLGLTHCEIAAVKRAFGLPHTIRRSIRILNLDHTLIDDVSDVFTEGQVNVDARGSISRSATVSLFDPLKSIGLDVSSPLGGIVSPRYLLQIHRGLYVDELERWVDIPAGVLWFKKPDRDGDILTIEAQGKESIAQYPVAKQLSFSAATNKMTVIKTIMQSIGETRFRLDSTTERLSSKFIVDISMTPWQACKKIADGMGRQLFYDAEGYLVCRVRPTDPVFTFRCGNDGTIRSEPVPTYSDDVYNAVRATGATPEGQDNPISATANVRPDSQLYITRDGKFIPLRYDVDNDKLATVAAVKSFASDTLDDVIRDTQTAAWDSSPVWILDQGDPVILTDALDDHGRGATYSVRVNMNTFSFPLTLGDQSNGYMTRVSRSKRKLVRKA